MKNLMLSQLECVNSLSYDDLPPLSIRAQADVSLSPFDTKMQLGASWA